jgi:DNA-binding CsgD family transcriptional regulator
VDCPQETDGLLKGLVMSALQTGSQGSARNSQADGEVRLSPRQTECLFWVQEGKSSRDIGIILGVSHRIVERHVFKACHKLGVKTRLQAVIRARALGLIADPPLQGREPRHF